MFCALPLVTLEVTKATIRFSDVVLYVDNAIKKPHCRRLSRCSASYTLNYSSKERNNYAMSALPKDQGSSIESCSLPGVIKDCITILELWSVCT